MKHELSIGISTKIFLSSILIVGKIDKNISFLNQSIENNVVQHAFQMQHEYEISEKELNYKSTGSALQMQNNNYKNVKQVLEYCITSTS